MRNPIQEPPASSKAPKQGLKEIDVLCTFQIKIESQNSNHGCIKDWRPYQNQDQDAKPRSAPFRVLQSWKLGLKGHGCSLHLQYQDREPESRTWVCQRPVIILKSRSRCQTQVRNPLAPSKAPNEDLEEMDVLCTLKIKIES